MAVFHRDRHRAVLGTAVHFQHAAPEKLGYAVNAIAVKSSVT